MYDEHLGKCLLERWRYSVHFMRIPAVNEVEKSGRWTGMAFRPAVQRTMRGSACFGAWQIVTNNTPALPMRVCAWETLATVQRLTPSIEEFRIENVLDFHPRLRQGMMSKRRTRQNRATIVNKAPHLCVLGERSGGPVARRSRPGIGVAWRKHQSVRTHSWRLPF